MRWSEVGWGMINRLRHQDPDRFALCAVVLLGNLRKEQLLWRARRCGWKVRTDAAAAAWAAAERRLHSPVQLSFAHVVLFVEGHARTAITSEVVDVIAVPSPVKIDASGPPGSRLSVQSLVQPLEHLSAQSLASLRKSPSLCYTGPLPPPCSTDGTCLLRHPSPHRKTRNR